MTESNLKGGLLLILLQIILQNISVTYLADIGMLHNSLKSYILYFDLYSPFFLYVGKTIV